MCFVRMSDTMSDEENEPPYREGEWTTFTVRSQKTGSNQSIYLSRAVTAAAGCEPGDILEVRIRVRKKKSRVKPFDLPKPKKEEE